MRNRIITAATLAALALSTGIATLGHAQADPISRGVDYLRHQQLDDGSIPAGSFGGYTPTEMYVIAAAGDGFDPNAMRNSGVGAVSYLAAHAAAASASAGQAGLLAQAVVAAHGNAASFGGVNLVTAIANAYSVTSGAYGDGQTYTQAYAILGLRAAGSTVPAAAYADLVALQDSDGGWNYSNAKDNVAGSDTNSTAIALMALRGHTNATVATAAMAWLHTQQSSDAGFGSQLAWGTDPDSTALVIQALVAWGDSPDAAAWSKGGVSAYQSLVTQQDGDGGYGYQSTTSDGYTSSQAVLGLTREPLPGDHVYSSGATTLGADAAATTAVGYLKGQLLSNGGLRNPYTTGADLGSTCDLVIAAAAAGIDPATLSNGGASALAYLQAETNDSTVQSSAGKLAKLILAVVADRRDPASFGHNSLASLTALYAPATGAYGDGETATQSLAILALVADHQALPALAVTRLVALEDSDGGWNFTAAANDASGSDSNSTAMALMALAAANNHSRDAAAVAWLQTQEESDGGFGYQKPYGSDVDSTALVIQGLVAAHQNPASAAWAAAGVTPVMTLAAAQNGDGGFGFQSTMSDPFTSSQVPNGLLRAAFPVVPTFPVGGVGPVVTLTPTPTATAVPTAAATAVPATHAAAVTTTTTSDATPAASATPTPSTAPSPSPTGGVEAAATTPTAPLPATSVATLTPTTLNSSDWLWYALAGIGGLAIVLGVGGVAMRVRRR